MLHFDQNQRKEYNQRVSYLLDQITILSPIIHSGGFDSSHPFDMSKLVAVEYALEDLQTFLRTVDLPVEQPAHVRW